MKITHSPIRILPWVMLLVAAVVFFSWMPRLVSAQGTPGTTATVTAAAKAAPQYPPITTNSAVRATLIMVLFVIIAVLIASRRIPAMVALPIMAFGIGLIAGIPLFDPVGTPPKEMKGLLATVIEGLKPANAASPQGVFRLYDAVIYTLLGGMFARFISDSKIAERIIKYAAEFGGEDPFMVSLLMSLITVMIFTAIGGLPAIIMLGTVMFPVLLSLGVPPVVCGGMLLIAFPIGSTLNPAGWATAESMYKISTAESMTFFLCWAGAQAVALFVFLSVEFLRMKRSTVTIGSILRNIAMVVMAAAVFLGIIFADSAANHVPVAYKEAFSAFLTGRHYAWEGIRWILGAVIVFGLLHTQWQYWVGGKVTSQWNMLTPAMPILLILVLGFSRTYGAKNDQLVLVAPAFLASLAYGYFTTPRERGMQRLGKSIMDGVADVGAPIVLMLGIGMLVNAAMHETTRQVLTPILAQFIPTSKWGYVVFFLLASPLALYRGPLNEFGLGVGVANLLQTFIPAGATMGAVRSVGMLQDPTTTQNVWVCGYLKLDINALLFKLFFYSIALCVTGLLMSALLFFPSK